MKDQKQLTLGSLFDGIGGFPLAALAYGITPVWASEIEPSCVSITRRHFPYVKHLGDVTKINGAEIEPVDIITFGSPCQDLSVAGKRAGLAGARSGLFGEAIRIIEEMRKATNDLYPTWAVWENVPGALSSNDGLDFRAVLQSFADAEIPMPAAGRWANAGLVRGGRYDFGWRILDAQYWGVPQRRRRIFLVCDFRGQRAAEVLFKPEGLRRYSAPRGTPGKGTANGPSGSPGDSNVERGQNEADRYNKTNRCINDAVDALHDKRTRSGNVAAFGETGPGYWQNGIQCLRAEGENRGSRPSDVVAYPDVARTLTARHDSSPCDDRGQNILVTAGFNGWRSNTGTIEYEKDRAPCVQATMPPNVLTDALVFDARGNGDGATAATLTGDHEGRITDYTTIAVHQNQCGEVRVGEKVNALNTNSNASGRNAPLVFACRTAQTGSNGCGVSEDIAYTLDGAEPCAVLRSPCKDTEDYKESDISSTLRVSHDITTEKLAITGVDCRNLTENNELSATLQAKTDGGHSLNYINPIRQGLAVRRLTPVECERLQGFPDGWTELGVFDLPISPQKLKRDLEKGVLRTGSTEAELLQTISDSRRYSAIGNSVAIPCVSYVLGGIAEAERTLPII